MGRLMWRLVIVGLVWMMMMMMTFATSSSSLSWFVTAIEDVNEGAIVPASTTTLAAYTDDGLAVEDGEGLTDEDDDDDGGKSGSKGGRKQQQQRGNNARGDDALLIVGTVVSSYLFYLTYLHIISLLLAIIHTYI